MTSEVLAMLYNANRGRAKAMKGSEINPMLPPPVVPKVTVREFCQYLMGGAS